MSDVGKLICDGAAAVAGAIRRGDVSCENVVEQCLSRISEKDSEINALMHVDADGAIRRARELDGEETGLRGPLFGVPIVLKDNIDVAAMPATAGIKAYAKNIPGRDAPLVANLRKGGAIILGKTTLHEGALGATNDNPFSGRTHNPLRHGYTPGGSSGGSAAAVAAGFAPLAIGSDTLGSVRVPAAYCGICGLKPTNGALSNVGMAPLADHLDTAGPMAPSIEDLRLAMLSLCQNDTPNAQTSSTSMWPTQNWLAPPRQDLKGVTIAVVTNFDSFDIEDEIVQVYTGMMRHASELGARLVKFDFELFDFGSIRRAGFIHAQKGAVEYHGARMKADPDGFSGNFHRAGEFIEKLEQSRLAKADVTIKTAVDLINKTFSRVNLIALPTTPQTAFDFADRVPDNQADLTALANLHGGPAASLPAGRVSGLPVGVQLMAQRHEDARLLQCASALEASL